MRLLVLLVPLICAQAQTTEILKAVENRYNAVKTLEVAFTEEFSGQGRARRKETGTLYLRKPGRMRWDYTSPAGKLFLSDGKFVYLYSPSTNQVQQTKVKSSDDLHTPLAFLIGKLDFQRDFARFIFRPEGGSTWVNAEPKSENAPYSKVEFSVTPRYVIERVRVTGYDRTVIDFAFQGEKLNPPLDDKLFRFTPPRGAQVEAER